MVHRNSRMDLSSSSLLFFLPFLIRVGLGNFFPPGGGALALLPHVAALGAFGFLARRYPPNGGKLHPASVGIGIAGALLWVGVCALDLESRWLPFLASSGARALPPPSPDAFWWIAKALGLLVTAPLVEEFFFRGFVQPAVGAAVTTVIFAGLHGAEAVAALLWFSLIGWWYSRTRSLWDAVLAHGITNLGLVALVMLLKAMGYDLTRLL